MSFLMLIIPWLSQSHYEPTSVEWILLASYVVIQFGPLYATWHEADGLTSIEKYVAKLIIINLHTFVWLLAIGGFVAVLDYYDPTYIFGEHVLMEQLGECAHRFHEIECETRVDRLFRHECFALGMCLSQPVPLLQLHAFLTELWRILETLALFGHISTLSWVWLDVAARWWRRGHWTAPLDEILGPTKENLGPLSSMLFDWIDSFNGPDGSGQ